MSLESRIAELTESIGHLRELLIDQNDLLRQNNALLEQNAQMRAELAASVPSEARSVPVTPRPAAPVPGGKRHQDAAALGRRPVGRPPKPKPEQQASIPAPVLKDGLKTFAQTDDDDVRTPAPAGSAGNPIVYAKPTPGTPQARAADLIEATTDPNEVDETRMQAILSALCTKTAFPETLEARREVVFEAMADASPDPEAPYKSFKDVDPADYPAMFASLGVRLGVFQANPEIAAPAAPVEDDQGEGEDWP